MALNQWQQAQDRTFNNFLGHMTIADGQELWTLPQENKIKVNSDAAIFELSNYFSFAMVARSHTGEVLHARSKFLTGYIAPEVAELWELEKP